jgi:hypothetical protein
LSPTLKIFIRVFSLQFYSSNISLFLLGLVISGGFMRSQDHLALAEYCISSPVFLFIPITLWSIYAMLISDFNSSTSQSVQHIFLRSIIFFPGRVQWKAYIIVVIVQLLPVYLYGLFIIAISLRDNALYPVLLLGASFLTLTLSLTWQLRQLLNPPLYEKRINPLKRWLLEKWNKPFILFPIEWSLRQQFFVLVSYKIASIGLLSSALYLYNTDHFDIRLAGMGGTLAFATNITFILALHKFLHYHFLLYRQQPFSIAQRFGYAVVTLMVFTLPEGIVLLRNFPDQFPWYTSFQIYLLGLALNLVCYSYLFIKPRKPENIMPFVYFLTVGTFLLVLAGLPITLIILTYTTASYFCMRRFYYGFEYAA